MSKQTTISPRPPQLLDEHDIPRFSFGEGAKFKKPRENYGVPTGILRYAQYTLNLLLDT